MKKLDINSNRKVNMAKILIADDSEMMREVLELILSKAGYEIFLAKNGSETLIQCKENKPDLVIMDTLTSEANHEDTLQMIKKHINPNIKAIFITGGNTEGSGFRRTLEKPITRKKLLYEVEQALQ